MRAPISWLGEYVELPAGLAARELADALIRVGMEVEGVESGADALTGPIVVGRVLGFEAEEQKNGKTIRWCQLDVGPHNNAEEPRGIICGAANFAVGDLVVVALPGAVLPGPFAITARKTYGHLSDGMICSVRELGIGEDHDGILILAADSAEPGVDALHVLGLRDAVLDVAITTDRGYCLSMRGLARESAAALKVPFRDIAVTLPAVDGGVYDVQIADVGCPQFSARAITGLDPAAPTPDWMVQRLVQSKVRSISLAVDVTNYVMLETGQPLHAFDRGKLRGPIVVRRATAGEKLVTLDDITRTLDEADLVVADDSGPLALAGIMGGASTEIDAGTTDIVLEAAVWDPPSIARTSRRHKLGSEASRRFERGVDPEIAAVALQRCVDLLVEFGGASPLTGFLVVGDPGTPAPIRLDPAYPAQVAGMAIPAADVVAHLEAVGCTVNGTDPLSVLPPTWRPDLLLPADLVEEVVRLAGYDTLPSILPTPHSGHGLTGSQLLRRAVSRALAHAGLSEVLSYPFVAPGVHDSFGLAADDPRRGALVLANPMSDAEPELRTSLLPGLLATLLRNLGRGARDVALFEMGLVFPGFPNGQRPAMPQLGVQRRPTEQELASLYAAVPAQPRHVAAVLTGEVERPGWWGAGRTATWAEAIAAAQVVATAARVELLVRPAEHAPWHPGRCAELLLGDVVLGYAGELHPRVVAAMGLPERTCAMEIDLDLMPVPGPATAPHISPYPPVLLDVALVVASDVESAAVLNALREGAGTLLESVRLFDVYVDEQRLGAGFKSLAFALRLRAEDRTLTVEEAAVARDGAVARASDLTGAVLRS